MPKLLHRREVLLLPRARILLGGCCQFPLRRVSLVAFLSLGARFRKLRWARNGRRCHENRQHR